MAGESPRKPWWRRWFGNRSERAAERFLKRLGYRIAARNYRCSHGELDIVAIDGDCIVLVEVRSTAQAETTGPAASVDQNKQRRLTNLALHYLQQHHLMNQPARFDVLTVSWPERQREPAIVQHRNAFPAIGRFQMYS